MLDDAERESLAETERQLARTDPHLAALMRGHARRRRLLSVGGWIVGMVGALLVVGLLWLGLPGQALLVAVLVTLALGRRRLRTGRWRSRR